MVRLLIVLVCIFVLLQLSAAGKFWHLTDVHFDSQYQVNSDPTTSCHNGTASPGASPNGDYHCDSPEPLVISAFKQMVAVEDAPDFIIWTGDDPPHSLVSYTENETLSDILAVTNWIKQYFPSVRVFPSLGNHDWYPAHLAPPSPNAYYTDIADFWSGWLSADAISSFKQGGFYSELIEPGYRLVALNTVFYYHLDNTTDGMTDPGGQFQWLKQTLNSARLAGELVYITAHVPPGYFEKEIGYIGNMKLSMNDLYLEAFATYDEIIIAHFYGHEHSDAIRLYYPDSTTNVSTQVMFLTPALTPWASPWQPNLPTNNPSLRLFEFDDSNYEISDYWTFWTNVSQNALENSIVWKLEYQASKTYPLIAGGYFSNATDMQQIVTAMQQPDSQLLQKYIAHNSVMYPQSCTGDCIKAQLCGITAIYIASYASCVQAALPKRLQDLVINIT